MKLKISIIPLVFFILFFFPQNSKESRCKTSYEVTFEKMPQFFSGHEDFTIDFWMHTYTDHNSGLYQAIVPIEDVFALYQDGDNMYWLWYDSDGETTIEDTTIVQADEDYFHYAIVHDQANEQTLIYLNGVLTHTSLNNKFIGKISKFELTGKDGITTATTARKNFLHFRVWNILLTETQITTYMNTYYIAQELENNILIYYAFTDLFGAYDKYFTPDRSRFKNWSFFVEDGFGLYTYDTAEPAGLTVWPYAYNEVNSVLLQSHKLELEIAESMAYDWSIEMHIYISTQTGDFPFLSQPDCADGLLIKTTASTNGDYLYWYPDADNLSTELEMEFDFETWIPIYLGNDEYNGQITYGASSRTGDGLNYAVSLDIEGGSSFCTSTNLVFNADEQDLLIYIRHFKIWTEVLDPQLFRVFSGDLYERDHINLIAYYKFYEDLDVAFQDSTDFDNQIITTLDSSYYSTEGDKARLAGEGYNGFYFLQVTNGYITYPASALPTIHDSETISLWVYIDTVSADECIFHRADHFKFSQITGDLLELTLTYDDIDITKTAEMDADNWDFVSFSKSLSPNYNNIILGRDEFSEQSTGSAHKDYTGNDLQLGHCDAANILSKGYFRQLSIFDHYKSLSEIKSFKYRNHKSYEPGLLFYAKLSEIEARSPEYSDQINGVEPSAEVGVRMSTLYGTFLCPTYKRTYQNGHCADNPFLVFSGLQEIELEGQILNIKIDFTLQTLFKISGSRIFEIILFKSEGIFEIGINTSGYLTVSLSGRNSPDFEGEFSTSLPQDTFFHLTIMKSNYDMLLYFDSELQETLTTETLYLNRGTATTMPLRSDLNYLWLKEYRVFNRKLTQREMERNMLSEIDGRLFPLSLKYYYKLEETNISEISDFASFSPENLLSPQISVDLTDKIGLAWDSFTDVKLCGPYQIMEGNRCVFAEGNFLFKGTATLPTTNTITIPSSFTFQFWVYIANPDLWRPVVMEKDSDFLIEVTNSNMYFTSTETNPSGETEYSASYGDYDAWHHVHIANSNDVIDQFAVIIDRFTVFANDQAFLRETEVDSLLCLGSPCVEDSIRAFTGAFREIKIWDKFISHGDMLKSFHYQPDITMIKGLLHYWKFDDAYGTVVYDSGSSEEHFQDSIGYYWREGYSELPICNFEQYYDHDTEQCEMQLNILKINQATTIPIQIYQGKEIGTDLTINFWFYIPTPGAYSIELENRFKFEGDVDSNFNIYFIADVDTLVETIADIPNDTWIYFYLTFDDLTNLIHYYLVEFDYTTISEYLGEFTHDFTIDATNLLNIENTDAVVYLQELQIFNSFNEREVIHTEEYIKHTINPTNFDDLITYWKFDEREGDTIADSSGFGEYLTFTTEISWITETDNYFPLEISRDENVEITEAVIEIADEIDMIYTFDNHEVTCMKEEDCVCIDSTGATCSDSADGNIINNHSQITVMPFDSETTSIFSYSFIPSVDSSFYSLSSDKFLIIEEQAFEPGLTYRIDIEETEDYGFGDQNTKRLYFFVASDPISGELLLDPTEGDAFDTTFQLRALDFINNEEGDLEYTFQYQLNGQEFIYLLKDTSTELSMITKLPAGGAGNEISIILTVTNIYGGKVVLEDTLEVSPVEVDDQYQVVSDEITDSEEKTIWERLLVLSFGVSFLETSAEISNECTDCSSHGVCDETFKVCICDTEYYGRDCSLVYSEYSDDLEFRNLLLDYIQTIVEENEDLELIFEENAADLLIGNIDQIITAQNIADPALNLKAQLVISEIAEFIEDDFSLSTPDSNQLLLRQGAGLSEFAMETTIADIGLIGQGLMLELFTAIATEAEKEEIEEIIDYISDLPTLLTKVPLLGDQVIVPGYTETYQTSSFSLYLAGVSSSDIKGTKLQVDDANSPQILFPSTYEYPSLSSNEFYTLQFIYWKFNPYEFYIPESSLGGDLSEVFLLAESSFLQIDLIDVDPPIQITMTMAPALNSTVTIECFYFDLSSKEFSSQGLSIDPTSAEYQETSAVSQDFICFTEHLSFFTVLFDYTLPPVIIERSNWMYWFLVILTAICGPLMLLFFIYERYDTYQSSKTKLVVYRPPPTVAVPVQPMADAITSPTPERKERLRWFRKSPETECASTQRKYYEPNCKYPGDGQESCAQKYGKEEVGLALRQQDAIHRPSSKKSALELWYKKAKPTPREETPYDYADSKRKGQDRYLHQGKVGNSVQWAAELMVTSSKFKRTKSYKQVIPVKANVVEDYDSDEDPKSSNKGGLSARGIKSERAPTINKKKAMQSSINVFKTIKSYNTILTKKNREAEIKKKSTLQINITKPRKNSSNTPLKQSTKTKKAKTKKRRNHNTRTAPSVRKSSRTMKWFQTMKNSKKDEGAADDEEDEEEDDAECEYEDESEEEEEEEDLREFSGRISEEESQTSERSKSITKEQSIMQKEKEELQRRQEEEKKEEEKLELQRKRIIQEQDKLTKAQRSRERHYSAYFYSSNMDLNWFIYYQANVRWWSRLFLLYFKIIIINLVLGYCFDLEFFDVADDEELLNLYQPILISVAIAIPAIIILSLLLNNYLNLCLCIREKVELDSHQNSLSGETMQAPQIVRDMENRETSGRGEPETQGRIDNPPVGMVNSPTSRNRTENRPLTLPNNTNQLIARRRRRNKKEKIPDTGWSLKVLLGLICGIAGIVVSWILIINLADSFTKQKVELWLLTLAVAMGVDALLQILKYFLILIFACKYKRRDISKFLSLNLITGSLMIVKDWEESEKLAEIENLHQAREREHINHPIADNLAESTEGNPNPAPRQHFYQINVVEQRGVLD